jgi:hypothetical protein
LVLEVRALRKAAVRLQAVEAERDDLQAQLDGERRARATAEAERQQGVLDLKRYGELWAAER